MGKDTAQEQALGLSRSSPVALIHPLPTNRLRQAGSRNRSVASGDCPKPPGAVCELMFKKPNSLYEVALMSVAGALFITLLVRTAFAFGLG
jgi:hypothetical protein